MSPEEIQMIIKKLEEKHTDFVILAKANKKIVPEHLEVAYFQVVKAIEDFSSDQNNAVILWQKRIHSAINVELYEMELKGWKDKDNPNRIPAGKDKFILKEDLKIYNTLKKKKINPTMIIPELYDIVLNRIIDISKIIHEINTVNKQINDRSVDEKVLILTKDGSRVSREFRDYYNYIIDYETSLREELKTGIATSGYIKSISKLNKNFTKEREQAEKIKIENEIKKRQEDIKNTKIKLEMEIKSFASKYIKEDLSNWKMEDILESMRSKLQQLNHTDFEKYKSLIEEMSELNKNKDPKKKIVLLDRIPGKKAQSPTNLTELNNNIIAINIEIESIKDKAKKNPDFPSEIASDGVIVCSEDIQRYHRLITNLKEYEDIIDSLNNYLRTMESPMKKVA